MTYRPGDTYTGQFTTQRVDTGAKTNADTLPNATLTRNGTDDGAVTLTVTNMAVGRYKVSGTIPLTYVSSDQIQIIVSATVNSIAGTHVAESFVIEAKNNNDLFNEMQSGSLVGTVNDAAPLASAFKVSADFPAVDLVQGVLLFRSGALKGIARPISVYDTGTRLVTLSEAFPLDPADTDACEILGFFNL